MRSSHLSSGVPRFWPWAVGFAPALALLVIMLPLRGLVPFLDSWRFVGQYQDWLTGQYTWDAFLAHHYEHPSAVGKVIYFAVLHWLHGEVGLLPLLSWGFAVCIAVCVCLLARPLWAGSPVRGSVLMVCVNLIIFSTAQADAWVWDFLFQNFIPGVCLVAGMVVLSTGKLGVVRIMAVAALSVIAAFSFGSGFLVGFLFSILIWDGTRERSLPQRCLGVGAWLAFAGLATWATHGGAVHAEVKAIGDVLVPDRPVMGLQFLLALLGRMLGEGTVFEPQGLAAVMGGALMLVFVACVALLIRLRRHRELVSASLPWIACSLYGLGTALLICVGRMNRSFNPALADRYVSFTLFFVLGTMLLAATVLRHAETTGYMAHRVRRALTPVLVLFIAAQLSNWKQGYQTMKLWHTRMEQERAMVAFTRVLPPDPEWKHARQTRPSIVRLAKDLADQNRLRHVTMAPDNRLSSFQHGTKLPATWASLDKPVLMEDGRWKLSGKGGLSDSSVADLILLTAESPGEAEQIFALAAPLLPDTFWERRTQRRRYPEHFCGWSRTISPSDLPKGLLTLRAYAFDHDKQVVRAMDGIHKVEARAD